MASLDGSTSFLTFRDIVEPLSPVMYEPASPCVASPNLQDADNFFGNTLMVLSASFSWMSLSCASEEAEPHLVPLPPSPVLSMSVVVSSTPEAILPLDPALVPLPPVSPAVSYGLEYRGAPAILMDTPEMLSSVRFASPAWHATSTFADTIDEAADLFSAWSLSPDVTAVEPPLAGPEELVYISSTIMTPLRGSLHLLRSCCSRQ